LVAARKRYGVVVCPHTATALHELMRRRDTGSADPWIAVSTAHPAKFETIVEPLLGESIPVPDSLTGLLARPSQKRQIGASYQELVEALS
jgi:threonine synthase